ncbi:MAG TPA: BRCT domain-containing protein [Planctomycetota bacterium]|jgi:hypothetical protein
MKEESGPLIALILFVILSALFGTFAWMKNQELNGDTPDKSKDAEIAKLKASIKADEGEIDLLRSREARLRKEIRVQQAEYDLNSDLFAVYGGEYERRRLLVAWADGFQKQAVDLSGTVNKLKSETLTRLTKDTSDAREKMEKDLQEKNTAKEEAMGRTRKVKEEFEADSKKVRQVRNYEQSALDESKSELADLTQREVERADVMMQPDGKVILSDPVHNTIVIDIGTSVGVKNGYRFEVFTMRPGKKKAVKGYIEVRHADPSKSECLIVQRPTALPRDPLSNYTAKEPEEMFSPYQQSGKKEYSAQALTGASKPMVLGMSKTDPIVEGDFVQNPLFAPGKNFTYYIAGAKEIVGERQKSAILYRWTEIKSMIEFYGGKVSPVADTTVNYVIAQKKPGEDGTQQEIDEYKKAVNLGLPVIYEWELFRFLEKK